MTVTSAQLTASFEKGVADARKGHSLSTGLKIRAGKLRTFWEAGFFKEHKILSAKIVAHTKTPEYALAVAQQRAVRQALQDSFKAIECGDFVKAQSLMDLIMRETDR